MFKFPDLNIHFLFLQYILRLSFKEVESRVSKLAILPVLREKSIDFTQRMMTRVFPLLAGTDLAALTFFFGLLEQEQEKILCGLTAADHSKLIKKLRSICSG